MKSRQIKFTGAMKQAAETQPCPHATTRASRASKYSPHVGIKQIGRQMRHALKDVPQVTAEQYQFVKQIMNPPYNSSAPASSETPPVDNDHVAPGCEPFASKPPAGALRAQIVGEDPSAPKAKIHVVIATPKRAFRGMQDLPPYVGHALKELLLRGTPRPVDADEHALKEWESVQGPNPEQDAYFRRLADRYTFEFMAAVGGMCRARNGCVAEFLAGPGQFLLWLDDDLDKDTARDGYATLAECVLRLLTHRQPAVGMLYCTRKKRPHWACTFMPAASLRADQKREGLLQVAELAGGATLWHRKVFTELDRIFGEEPLKREPKEPSIRYRDRDTGETLAGFYQNLVMDGDLLSEDYWMSWLCRCAGIPLLVDTNLKLRHREEGGGVYPEGDFPPIPAVDAEEEEK